MKTRGIGTIEAHPYVDSEGNLQHDLQEHYCRLVLNRRLGLWFGRTQDKRRVIVPKELAIVVWSSLRQKEKEGDDRYTRVAEDPTTQKRCDAMVMGENATAERCVLQSGHGAPHSATAQLVSAPPFCAPDAKGDAVRPMRVEEPAAPVHRCPTCKVAYGRKLEAYLCSLRCNTEKVPEGDPSRRVLEAGDCKVCGFPLGLHHGARVEQDGTRDKKRRDYIGLPERGEFKDHIEEVPVYAAKFEEGAQPIAGRPCYVFDGEVYAAVPPLNPKGDNGSSADGIVGKG